METIVHRLTGAGASFDLHLPASWNWEEVNPDIHCWCCGPEDETAALWVYVWNATEEYRSDDPKEVLAAAAAQGAEAKMTDSAADVRLTPAPWGMRVTGIYRDRTEVDQGQGPWIVGRMAAVVSSGDLGPIQIRLELVMDDHHADTPRWRELWTHVQEEGERLGTLFHGAASAFGTDGTLQWRSAELPLHSGPGASMIPLGWRSERRAGDLWRFDSPQRQWTLETKCEGVSAAKHTIPQIMTAVIDFSRGNLNCEEPLQPDMDDLGGQLLVRFRGAFDRPDEQVWRWHTIARMGDVLLIHRFTLSCAASDAHSPETLALVAFYTRQSDILRAHAEAA